MTQESGVSNSGAGNNHVPVPTSDQSGKEILGRFRAVKPVRFSLQVLDDHFNGGIPFGNRVEIFGPPCSGKTALLKQIAAVYALPSQIVLPADGSSIQTYFGGGKVFYIDTDHKLDTIFFDAVLVACLEHRLQMLGIGGSISDAEINLIIEKASENIMIVQPKSTAEAAAALQGISRLSGEVEIVLLDSSTAFFHIDEYLAESCSSKSPELLKCIKKVSDDCCPVVWSTQAMYTKSFLDAAARKDCPVPSFLGPAWTLSPCVRFSLIPLASPGDAGLATEGVEVRVFRRYSNPAIESSSFPSKYARVLLDSQGWHVYLM